MKKTLAFILALTMIFSLCACGSGDSSSAPGSSSTQAPATEPSTEPTTEPTTEPSQEPTTEPTDEPDEQPASSGSDIVVEYPASGTDLSAEPINIMVLNGTTGFGMAQLISESNAGTSLLKYNISVETDASNITAALINGTVDIAALPTNAASVVYNKTEGEVQLLALNTAGVLYLVSNGESISCLADLEGKTVYAPAQNPSFIFSALCQQAGVNVTVDTSYAQPADLRTAVAAGEVALAVLPEPMVTMACAANAELTVALDLTEQWSLSFGSDSLVQGCLVVRRDFAESHAAELGIFLLEYETSIDFLSSDPAAAAEMIVSAGIFANAAVAQKAIPNCNIIFLAGQDMVEPMSGFLQTMFQVAPASIGGAVPADDFYYIG